MTGAVLAASVPSRSRMLGLDLKHRTAVLRYSVAKDVWGRGLVPEAAKALIDWGFQSFTHFRGEQVDEILCGLLRKEWEQRRHREAGSGASYSEAAI